MRAYADQLGLRLVRDIVHRGAGPIITSRQALEAADGLGLSESHAYKLLSQLAHAGWLRRLKGGLYTLTPASGGPEAPHPFAVGTKVADPGAISHWSALHHWGLVEQIPMRVTVSSPRSIVPPSVRAAQAKPRRDGHAVWTIDGVDYEFVRIPTKALFGVNRVWVDATTAVPMFDKERALLDTFAHLKGFGAGRLGDELLSRARDEVDVEMLVDYAHRLDQPGTLRRVEAAVRARTSGDRDE